MEQAEIIQWIEFADSDLNPNVSVWTFPFLGLRSYNKQVWKKHAAKFRVVSLVKNYSKNTVLLSC